MLLTSEKPKRRFAKFLKIMLAVVVVLAIIAAAGGYLYWRHLRSTPQYSLALLIDAARRNDDAAVRELVDTDAVVDALVPQVMEKAVEFYGRGLPPETIEMARVAALPLMPAIKENARRELPQLIRDKTDAFADVPFFAMAAGAERYLAVEIHGDEADLRSIVPEYSFEVKMRRSGDVWRITEIRDEQLASNIARTVGEQIMSAFGNGLDPKPAEDVLRDLMKIAENALKKE